MHDAVANNAARSRVRTVSWKYALVSPGLVEQTLGSGVTTVVAWDARCFDKNLANGRCGCGIKHG
ncbi:hypothetical protein PgNI_11296 [Pyricularia grisea]|uniref:Uncharacterized protein n=1 Tax=Pyricularia grisea TaxID=148305 RepID=A0A6P8APE2_PYRGI|nr:hypothetical protein PgNI_11296 [Pyricularia grisea]TLD03902.1 hypothetical protein PgNI_11296 [Pyricularia grisea]